MQTLVGSQPSTASMHVNLHAEQQHAQLAYHSGVCVALLVQLAQASELRLQGHARLDTVLETADC